MSKRLNPRRVGKVCSLLMKVELNAFNNKLLELMQSMRRIWELQQAEVKAQARPKKRATKAKRR